MLQLGFAQKPYANCWHPDDIKDWTPENDVNAKFNRATIKLQPRFKDTTVMANPNQYYDGQLAACLTMNPACSRCPAQGDNNFIGYNPTYWQYMDILIWWGGSAGEGIIIPPSAPVIDAAHMSGVKVLGNLFFPPGYFGGQSSWVIQMTTKEGDSYPYAKKLYEIAKYYGFDGWFINEETGGSTKETWKEWMHYYMDLAEADGVKHELQWYGSSPSIISKDIEDLYKRDGLSFFANYGSASADNIKENTQRIYDAGLTPTEAFHTLYSGIECAQGGVAGNGKYIQNCFPVTGHKGSIDLFCPEEHTWKDHIKPLLDQPTACGEQAYAGMKTSFENEARFWVNPQHDPSDVTARSGSTNPGFANCLAERSTIQKLPFVTTFSAGLGKARYVNGKNKGTHDWYHRGMQTLLPTWRWWIENNNNNDLSITLNWDDAFNMGTSLKVSGKLQTATHYLTRLYKTKLNITEGCRLQLVYKSNTEGSLKIKLATSEDDNNFSTFDVNASNEINGWSVANIDLSSLAEKTISVIAIDFQSASEVSQFEATLGQLAIYPAQYTPQNCSISEIKAQNELSNSPCDVRLTWDSNLNEDFDHFNIYLIRQGNTTLVGQTRQMAFYVPDIMRNSSHEMNITLGVSPVTKDMQEGTMVTKELAFPLIDKPSVTLKASKTLVHVNEEITVEAFGTNYPDSYEWTLPQGGVLVRQENNQAVIKFTQEGIFDVTASVGNSSGATKATLHQFIEVDNSKTITLVSEGANIVSETGHIGIESPANIVDGNTAGSMQQKWCNGGKKSHSVVLDLKKAFRLYRFKWYDCGSNEEGENVPCYRIELSKDLENWTEVLDVKEASDINIKDDYIKSTVARYVRFTAYNEENKFTIRIWEFQAFGHEGNLKIDPIDPITIDVKSTHHITVPYTLGTDAKADNFAAKITLNPNHFAQIQNVKTENEQVSFDLIAGNNRGQSEIEITLTNGEWVASSTALITVNDPNCTNLVLNNIPTVVTVSNKFDDKNYPERDKGAVGPKGITDNKLDTWWSSAYKGGKTDNYITFDLGENTCDLSFIRFVFKKHGYLKYPVDADIFASKTTDEDSKYVKVAHIANITTDEVETGISNAAAASGVKFVKILINSVSNYGFSLVELEVLGKLHDDAPTVTPVLEAITITSGLNADVIAESKPVSEATTAVLDNQGWVLFTCDVEESGAICNGDGAITTKEGTTFKLNPKTQNAAQIRQIDESVTLEFEPIEKATTAHLLGICANGSANIEVVINYQDGSSSPINSIQILDWYQDNEAGTAVYGLDRIITEDLGASYKKDQLDGRKNFCLYEQTVSIDPEKTTISITCTNKGGGQPTLLGLAIEHTPNSDSIEEIENHQLQVSPNPVANGETLQIKAHKGSLIQISTLQGIILQETNAQSDITLLTVRGMSQGTYLVIIKNKQKTSIAKVLVQ
jgi:endo-beta-N-acetylglucosaminidase D